MKRRWLVLSMMVLSLVIALPASTQSPTKSLLFNGDFDTNVSGWVAEAGTLVRTEVDPYSGLGAAQVTIDEGDGYAWIYQCIDLTGELDDWPVAGDGKKYMTFNGYLKSNGEVEAALDLQFYEDAACADITGEPASSVFTSAETWEYVSATAEIPETAPGSVMSAFWTPDLGVFYVDELAVYSSASVNAVQLQGLAVRGGLWGVGLIGVLAAGVVLARRRKGL